MKFAASSVILSVLSLSACDAAPEQCTSLRLGETETLYISQNDAEISVFEFAEMVLSCPAKPKLAVTFTRHPTPTFGPDSQVIGLGFSVSADSEWAQCYEDLMIGMGAHPLP